MKIEVHLYATLTRYIPEDVRNEDRSIEVPDGVTIEEVLETLKVPLDHVKLVFVDGVRANLKSELKPGSRLGVFPPVGGG
jgi:sulfur carrier protein ThiS